MKPRNLAEAREWLSEMKQCLKGRALRTHTIPSNANLLELCMALMAYIDALDIWREFQRRDRQAKAKRGSAGSPGRVRSLDDRPPDPPPPLADQVLHLASELRAGRLPKKKR